MYNIHDQQLGYTRLRTLPTEPASECEILWLDRNTLRVDSSKVGILKEGDEVSLSSFLQCHDGR